MDQMDCEVEMSGHRLIRDEDVTERQWRWARGVTVQLVHRPSTIVAQATDETDLLARTKAWVLLRDKLEGYS